MNEEEEVVKPDLRVIIPLAYYRKIMSYVHACPTEITGFADVTYDREQNAFRVGEVYLLKQEATGVEVEMDEDVIADFNLQCIDKGMTQLPRLWWHSHVDMEAYLSPTDEETLLGLENETFMIALVLNKREELCAKVTLFQPIYMEFEDVPVKISYALMKLPEEIIQEVKDKVKPKIYKPEKDDDYPTGLARGAKIIQFLPKTLDAALAKIKELSLVRVWDKDRHDWKYVDWKNGRTFLDGAQIVTQADYFSVKAQRSN